MEIKNLNEPVKNQFGKVMKENQEKDAKDVTIKFMIGNIVAGGFPDGTRAQAMRVYKLANMIFEAGETLEIGQDDVKLISRCFDIALKQSTNTYAIGQVLEMSGLEVPDAK